MATIPKRNQKFWLEKFRVNRMRDDRKEAELIELGYRVLTIWQCELRECEALRSKIQEVLCKSVETPRKFTANGGSN